MQAETKIMMSWSPNESNFLISLPFVRGGPWGGDHSQKTKFQFVFSNCEKTLILLSIFKIRDFLLNIETHMELRNVLIPFWILTRELTIPSKSIKRYRLKFNSQ